MKDSDLSIGLSNLSMKEAILYKHGLQGPATHKRNSTSSPIDGIWVTQGLEITNCGHNMTPLQKRAPRRLHCRDLRLINNYIKLYHQYAGPLDLFRLVKDLERRAPNMPKSEIIQEYKSIDNLRCDAAALAERHCRKLRTGQVSFSPELNLCRKRIQAWLLLISRTKNRKVSSRLIRRTLAKAKLDPTTRGFGLESLEEVLQEEYKAYYNLKGEANQLRMNALEE
jgi:hypothetical protein